MMPLKEARHPNLKQAPLKAQPVSLRVRSFPRLPSHAVPHHTQENHLQESLDRRLAVLLALGHQACARESFSSGQRFRLSLSVFLSIYE